MVYLPSNSRQPKNFDAMQQLLSGSQKTLLFSIFLRNRTTTCTLWVTAQDFHAFNKYFTLLVSTLCIFVLFLLNLSHMLLLYIKRFRILFSKHLQSIFTLPNILPSSLMLKCMQINIEKTDVRKFAPCHAAPSGT